MSGLNSLVCRSQAAQAEVRFDSDWRSRLLHPAMRRERRIAKAAYQNFLMLWKDADPDIPILIAAKSEYAKLK
jgi:hypothetical protein